MKELKIYQLESLIKEMMLLQASHPKADVTYDPEKRRINITYPLPKDFMTIKEIKIGNFKD